MKSLFTLLFFLAGMTGLAHGFANLVYRKGEEVFAIEGFDFTRPYRTINGEKNYLPIEGEWGLEIKDKSFWENCYFPQSFKLRRELVAAGETGGFQIDMVNDGFPDPNQPSPANSAAVHWKGGSFASSILVLGWCFEDRVTEVSVVLADNYLSKAVFDRAFGDFVIQDAHLSGFPFLCLFDKETLGLEKPETNFSPVSTDYLYRLACRGSAEDFRKLGFSGKELSQVRTENELSLLHGASLYGNLEVMRFLEEMDAAKVKSKDSDSPMHYAVFGGRLEAVRLLDNLGYSALDKSKLDITPLDESIRLGHHPIFDFFTENAKYAKSRKDVGSLALKSILFKRPRIYDILKRKTNGNIFIETERSRLAPMAYEKVLYDNCLLGSPELVSALLASEAGKGLDINKVKVMGYTPLRAAVKSGNLELIRLLLSAGADLSENYEPSATTLLHDAAIRGQSEIIRFLVESGMDKNVTDGRGFTPLYSAVVAKQVNSVYELLALGADPNLRPEKRPAAVWMAVVQDERESIKSLIEYGATCELDATLAMQLMDYALAFDIPEVVKISLEQCLTHDFSFQGAVPGVWVADYYGSELCKKVLIEGGADPSAAPKWEFKKPDAALGRALNMEGFSVNYPKRLREKYGDLKVKIEVVLDPVGKIRFPKFKEELPWDLRLFLRESIRKWSVDLPPGDQINTAYRLIIPLELKTDDYGVKIFEIAELDQPPVPIIRFAPVYPAALKRERVQGEVTVVFIVDEEGIVDNANVEASTHRDFNESALAAVRQWRFEPGVKDGLPVKTRVRLPLSFTLR